MNNKIQKKLTISQKVYDKLEHMIVFCEIEPKSVLTELELCKILNVSRTPVREALRKLSTERLVEISKSGILVPDISVETQLKLLQVRRVIEKLCVECAIENASQNDVQKIKDIIRHLNETENLAFLNYLTQIHHILAKVAKNEFLEQSLSSVQGLSRRFWQYYAKEEDYNIARNLHKNLLSQIVTKDISNAINASTKLIDYLENFAKAKLP